MRISITLLLLCLLLLFAAPVVAQEATPEVTPPVVAPVASPDGFAYINVGVTVAFVVGGLLGALAGGGSALAVISRINKDTKDNAERLYEGLSPKWQDTIRQAIVGSQEAVRVAAAGLAVLNEVTDKKPNAATMPSVASQWPDASGTSTGVVSSSSSSWTPPTP